ncbi:MAG TPA: oxidoreductase [Acidisphaera sp.]|nr:oxidoreductase [Acidisphaera sp.]
MASDRVWFITGCSTGFGRALAERVRERGERAVVTARHTDSIKDLASDRVRAVALDVTDDAQVRDAVGIALREFGRIDVLVNNAGYGYMAAVEEGDEREIRAMFDTNVFGVVKMLKAVLPGMRERRSGHVVNLSSQGGIVSLAASGYYCATKFAVEAISEALSKEIGPLGVKVTLIEPGPFRTDFAGRSLKIEAHVIADYDATAGERKRLLPSYSGKQPGDPVRAAEAIIAIVDAPNPPLRLVLGKPALAAVRGKLADVARDVDAWEQLSLSADFPDA